LVLTGTSGLGPCRSPMPMAAQPSQCRACAYTQRSRSRVDDGSHLHLRPDRTHLVCSRKKWRRGSQDTGGCSCGSPGAICRGQTGGQTVGHDVDRVARRWRTLLPCLSICSDETYLVRQACWFAAPPTVPRQRGKDQSYPRSNRLLFRSATDCGSCGSIRRSRTTLFLSACFAPRLAASRLLTTSSTNSSKPTDSAARNIPRRGTPPYLTRRYSKATASHYQCPDAQSGTIGH
jgi:hypothetical protein